MGRLVQSAFNPRGTVTVRMVTPMTSSGIDRADQAILKTGSVLGFRLPPHRL
jgi:hypothetical protein